MQLEQYASGIEQYRVAISMGLGQLRYQLNNGPIPVVVDEAIQICEDSGNPHVLIGLLNLTLEFPGMASIIDRLERSGPATDAQVDPFEEMLLFTRAPFLARGNTRAALRALLNPTPLQPFVVINGLSKLGKTYTTQFIEHVLRMRTDIQYCGVEVSRDPKAAPPGADMLAQQLVVDLGGEPTVADPRNLPPNTQDEAWFNGNINRIISAGDRTKKWWIVLDGFNGPRLRDDTKELIVRLAHRLTSGAGKQRFRMVLLDFDKTILPVPPGRIADEWLAAIPRATVRDSVKTLFGAQAAALEIDDLFDQITVDLGEEISDLDKLTTRLQALIAAAETGV